MLTAAAKKGSIEARTSTWVALKPYHLIRKGASAENIPQTAKPSENARNDIHKTLGLPGGSAVTSSSITGFSTAPPTKRYIYLLRILIAGSPRLRQRIKLRFPLLIVTGEQRPHDAGDNTPRQRALRARIV
jgi:hypothetical protein